MFIIILEVSIWLPITVAVVTAMLSVIMIIGTYYGLKRHQAKN